MTANNDSDDSLSGHPSNQGQGGRDGDGEREGKGKGGKPTAATAPAKEGRGGRHHHQRSALNIHRGHNNNGSGNGNLKLYRRHNNQRPRNIPAAHFIQGYNECAYICEHEEDENEREYLPTAARRRGDVVYRLQLQQQQQQQIWQQQQQRATKVEEAKDDASALSVFAGKKLNASCHCFNCCVQEQKLSPSMEDSYSVSSLQPSRNAATLIIRRSACGASCSWSMRRLYNENSNLLNYAKSRHFHVQLLSHSHHNSHDDLLTTEDQLQL
eukprot:scaffold872_cov119-Skeletonema_dohrnii-CCMP3373.AAC.5